MQDQSNKKQPFKKLQNEWYKKLKDSGFEDIETPGGFLKGLSSSSGKPSNKEGYSWGERELYNKSKEEYYRLAGHFLHDYKFESNIEKFIWELHSNGVSVRSIVSVLKGLPYLNFNKEKSTISNLIIKLSQKMKEMYS